MSNLDFIEAINTAVATDNRLALVGLDQRNKDDRLRREAVRHADNLIIASKEKMEFAETYSRGALLRCLHQIKAEERGAA